MAPPQLRNWTFIPLDASAKRKPGLGTCALIAAVLGIIFGTIGWSHLKRRNAHPQAYKYGVCENAACNTYAAMLARSVSKTDSPCWNFYRFVCKGYINSSRSVFSDHMLHFTGHVDRTLATAVVPATGQTTAEKAAKCYQSCIGATVQPGQAQFAQFRRIMRDARVVWPAMSEHPDFLFSLAEIKAVLNLQSFLDIAASRGKNITTVHLWSTPVLTAFRDKRIQLGAAYRDYYTFFRAFYVFYDENVTEPVEYRKFIETENYVFSRLIQSKPKLVDIYAGVDALVNVTPSISPLRWSATFRRIRTDPPDTPLRVGRIDAALLRAVSDLLNDVGEASLHFYVGWIVVQQLAPFMSEELASRFHNGSENAILSRHLFCLAFTERIIGLAVYTKYETDMFDNHTRQELDQLINAIFSSMTSLIEKHGMEGPHKAVAQLAQFDNLLKNDVSLIRDERTLNFIFSGFEDMTSSFAENWRKSERARRAMSAESWLQIASSIFDTIVLSNHYYPPGRGFLKLQPYSTMLPLFDPRVRKSVSYGALGSFVAVAMFRFFNEPLSLEAKLISAAENRSLLRCYSRLGPNLTQTLAYQRAVSLTYLWKAFRERSSNTSASLQRNLPTNLDEYTDEELFYLAFCFPLCTGRPSEEAEHSCNEPLRHSQRFSQVFGCHNSSNMNPRFKCGIGY